MALSTPSCAELFHKFEASLHKDKSVLAAKRAANRLRKGTIEIGTVSTAATYLSRARKLVEKERPDLLNDIYQLLCLPKTSYIERKSTYKKTVSKRHKAGQVNIDMTALLNIAESELNEFGYIRRLLALIILTGRRPIEILSSGEFSESKKSGHIVFEGQAKVKERVEGKRDIPVLLSPKIVLAALKKLREEKADFVGLDNQTFNNRIAKQCTEAVRRVYSIHNIDHAYALRAAYACIAVELFKPASYSAQGYMSEILGHLEDDIQTASSYQRFSVSKTTNNEDKEC